MPLVDKTIPGLFNGVSQQPATTRLDTQGEIQENALSLIVDGLLKRPPTEWIADLVSNAGNNPFIHTINRDASERYVVIITEDTSDPIEVYTASGVKCDVLYDSDTKGYVLEDDSGNPIDPGDSLKAVTVADYTFLLNTTRTAAMIPTSETPGNPQALIWIKQGIADTEYTVKILSTSGSEIASVTHTTASSETNAPASTSAIAGELVNALDGVLDGDWTLENLGSTVLITNTKGDEFALKVTDSYGNQAMEGVKGSVQRFQNLPPEAKDGMILTVEGDDNSSFDNFYVKYRLDQSGTGVWVETVKPLLDNEIDPETVPHSLVRTGVNEFTLKQLDWEERHIGDEFSAPEPSFIGGKIKDVFFFKNRLGFLSGENVIFSRAGDFFNFFPSTATDVIASDPIDVAVSTNTVAILNHAVPFTETLMLFSDQQQFALRSSGGLLTPQTVSIDMSTAFETSRICKPVGAGPNVYFVVPSGANSRVREYFVQPNAQVNDAADVTAHVPRYLPSGITRLVSSSARDVLFGHSPEEPKNLYVYKFYWDGEEKVQSSWSKWIFDDEILSIAVLDNYLYLVCRKDGVVWLGRMNLEVATTSDFGYLVHLDRQCEVLGSYDSGTDTTTWTLPYSDSSDDFRVIEGNDGNRVTGAVKTDNTTIVASGNYSDVKAIIGKTYTMRYRFSRWYIRDRNGVARTPGRLQIRTLTLSFTDTGNFKIQVGQLSSVFTGIVLGVTLLGKPGLVTGEQRFIIMKNAADADIDLVNDSHLPCQIQTANFEGFWTPRSSKF